MKKLLFIFAFAAISIAVTAQGAFDGFFKPVTLNKSVQELTRAGTSTWLFRPTVQVTALQLAWNKDNKNFDASSFTSAGPGLSYNRYIDVNGSAYNNFGINGILLFGLSPGETVETTISFATTISLFEYFSFGAGYGFTEKNLFLLSQVKLKF